MVRWHGWDSVEGEVLALHVPGDRGTGRAILPDGLTVALSTLKGGAVRDFLASDRRGPAQQELRVAIVDCEMLGGLLTPIGPSSVHGPLLDRLRAAMKGAADMPGVPVEGHLVLFGKAEDARLVRLILIADQALLDSLDNHAAPEIVQPAELRLLKQLICGLNLSEAAAADGVGHETKRSQYKSLARKLGARSQTELAAKAMTQVLLDARDAAAARPSSADHEFVWLARAFIPSARTFQIPGAAGRLHRFVDVGPLDGLPLVMLHPQVLPDIREAEIADLHEVGVRVIAPLRNGALSAAAGPLGVEAHLDHACEGIELARTSFCGDKVHVMACISGGAYAVEYARRHARHVGSLAFVGACVRPNTGNGTAGRLRYGFLSLAMRNWAVYSRAIQFYGRRIRRPGALEQLLLSVYRPSASDLAVIRAEHAKPHEGERLRRFFSASVESIKHDFYHQAHPRWRDFPVGAFPTLFLHGDADFIHAISGVRELAASWEVPVVALPGAGQLVYHRHFGPVLRNWLRFRTGL